MLGEFIEYLIEQIGQPYLWGGQHTKLTPENYEEIIHKREDGRGKYADGTTYADASIAYCKKLFDSGETVLYAYDCSGLGMYWLSNLNHIYHDMTADGMMHKCVDVTTAGQPKKGWWVFRVSNGRATHIGYMVNDTELIEAKGRKFGVVKTKWKKSDWSQWGIPKCFYDEIVSPEPEPQPKPPTPETKQFVEVVGRSVRVRQSWKLTSRTVKIAHRGDTFPFVSYAPNGWYCIDLGDIEAFITSKPKYTKLVEK